MQSVLDEVQRKALAASEGKRGFGYFMEMGLGKTLTALADFQRALDDGDATRMLVVCPNSFKGGWRAEIAKHGFDFDAHIYETGSKASKAWLRGSFDRPPVLIMHYQGLRTAGGIADACAFADAKPTFGVFDESIQIKTFDSSQTKRSIELGKHLEFARILSGKPTTQGPHDLWAQMRAIGKLNGFNYHSFKTQFAVKGGWGGEQVIGVKNEEYLAELIEPHVFRALKADWTDLPPKSYTIREYDMSAEQAAQYASMHDDFVLWLTETDGVTIEQAITRYMKLAQIQAGFIIDEEKQVHELVTLAHNPRVNALKEVLETEVTGKVAIVYHHRYSGDILLRALVEGRPAYITGGMPAEVIEYQKSRFNDDPSCRYILLQDQASKYGHTLLGGPEPDNRCATTLFFENTYSLDTRSQVEDRIHRRGQTADNVLYVDFAGTPLDRNCIEALQRKEDLYQAVFSLIRRAVPGQKAVFA
jgi:hypothetical protein